MNYLILKDFLFNLDKWCDPEIILDEGTHATGPANWSNLWT
jgi:hypothetical protein